MIQIMREVLEAAHNEVGDDLAVTLYCWRILETDAGVPGAIDWQHEPNMTTWDGVRGAGDYWTSRQPWRIGEAGTDHTHALGQSPVECAVLY